MSNVELRDALDLIISMLRKHEDRLDAITKQVVAMNRAMESDGVKIQDKLDITGEDAPHEMKSVLVVDDDPN
ncbi:unnamed protein product, partial [marine sediment metagenome]